MITNHGVISIDGQTYSVAINQVTTEFCGRTMISAELLTPITANAMRYLTQKTIKPTTGIKDVIFNYPATIVIWNDGTKTVVKCQPGDVYNKETGLALCIAKKFLGNKGNFNEVFKKWIPEDPEE